MSEHVPYNTAPMSREERDKEIAKPGSGTPLKAAPKPDKAKKEKKPKKAAPSEE